MAALKTGSMTIEVGGLLTGSTIIAEQSTFFEEAMIRAEPWRTLPVLMTSIVGEHEGILGAKGHGVPRQHGFHSLTRR